MSLVELVDDTGAAIGTAEKLMAHRAPGMLHRAVSVVLFDGQQLLLQQRAETVDRFAGLWANTCCTHPAPGELAETAATRRLEEELGIRAEVREVGTFTYSAVDRRSGFVEFEYDHVVVGVFHGDPQADSSLVAAWAWTDITELRSDLAKAPEQFAPWMAQVVGIAVES